MKSTCGSGVPRFRGSGVRNLGVTLLLAIAAAPAHTIAAPPVTVTIDQVAFREKSVTARVGDTIEWVNKDIFDHTATAKNGEFNLEVPAGKKARVVLKKAGVIDYVCEYHPNMTAKIVVEEAPGCSSGSSSSACRRDDRASRRAATRSDRRATPASRAGSSRGGRSRSSSRTSP
ncbi:MAG TPA: cupredoxin domain-containing protein [Vicinamibacterales bacterium]|nr:cupredoxin domain-containing protein [Vicinamibacterales bacterium]